MNRLQLGGLVALILWGAALLWLSSCAPSPSLDHWVREANAGTVAVYGLTLDDLHIIPAQAQRQYPNPITFVHSVELTHHVPACLVPEVRGHQCFDRAMDWLRAHDHSPEYPHP